MGINFSQEGMQHCIFLGGHILKLSVSWKTFSKVVWHTDLENQEPKGGIVLCYWLALRPTFLGPTFPIFTIRGEGMFSEDMLDRISFLCFESDTSFLKVLLLNNIIHVSPSHCKYIYNYIFYTYWKTEEKPLENNFKLFLLWLGNEVLCWYI